MILKKYMVFLIVFGISITHVVYGQSQNKNLFDESVWRVEHLYNQKKIIQSYQEEKNFTHFSFNPYTHKVTGSGLCNKFLAKFEQHNDQITIHDIVTTHETCLLSDVNEQDNRFFSYLKSVKLFVIHGKVLRLIDTDNHSLIIARWIK